MKLTFFLNRMGPVAMRWYEENNIPYTSMCSPNKFSKTGWLEHKEYKTYYAGGRIDVHGHPDYPYNYEYGVPIMESSSWCEFGGWLDTLVLDYLPESLDDIVQMYENETGNKIIWFKRGEQTC